MIRLATIAGMALAFLSAAAGASEDVQSRRLQYEAFSVQNLTDQTIMYQMKWGREVETIVLAPGKTWHHARSLASESRPIPVIRYESGHCAQSFRLQTSLSETPGGGVVHRLQALRDGSVWLFRGR